MKFFGIWQLEVWVEAGVGCMKTFFFLPNYREFEFQEASGLSLFSTVVKSVGFEIRLTGIICQTQRLAVV